MFISGGENVYPAQVEKFLQTHPDIHEVAVLGVSDKKWGEVGIALVVRKKKTLTEEDVAGLHWKSCKIYSTKIHSVLEEIAKTDSGKIDRKKLKKDYINL